MRVALELKNGRSIIVQVNKTVHLTKNFILDELAYHGNGINYILNADVDLFLAMFQDFRLWFNEPINPSSGYRPADYNKQVGGVSNSLHIRNTAIDFPVKNFNDDRYMACAYKWKALNEKRGIIGEINFYPTYMHLGAFANKNGYKTFQCRDYRNPTGNKKYKLIEL